MLAQLLTKKIGLVCPIHGVSIRDSVDKATWRVDFKDEATQPEKDAAQLEVDNFDLAEVTAEEQRQAKFDDNIKQDTVVNQLKAMTNAEFDVWWAANVTNAAQAINVLKRVTRIVIRRL